MTVAGEELGAELYDLRRAGRVTLPELAAFYAQANRHVHNTRWDETAGFDQGRTVEYELNEDNVGVNHRTEDLGQTATITEGEVLGAVFGPWTSLRTRLQIYLGQTATRLVRAGVALDRIADAYALTDEEAACYLDTASQGLGDGPELPEIAYPHSGHETVVEEREITLFPNPFGDDVTTSYETEVLQEEPVNPLTDD